MITIIRIIVALVLCLNIIDYFFYGGQIEVKVWKGLAPVYRTRGGVAYMRMSGSTSKMSAETIQERAAHGRYNANASAHVCVFVCVNVVCECCVLMCLCLFVYHTRGGVAYMRMAASLTCAWRPPSIRCLRSAAHGQA